MTVEFESEIWYWRGPSPYYFVTMPSRESEELRSIAALLTYGWGVVPVTVRIGETEWTTSLFPKDARYLVPVKDRVRRAENLHEGDRVTIRLSADVRGENTI